MQDQADSGRRTKTKGNFNPAPVVSAGAASSDRVTGAIIPLHFFNTVDVLYAYLLTSCRFLDTLGQVPTPQHAIICHLCCTERALCRVGTANTRTNAFLTGLRDKMAVFFTSIRRRLCSRHIDHVDHFPTTVQILSR